MTNLIIDLVRSTSMTEFIDRAIPLAYKCDRAAVLGTLSISDWLRFDKTGMSSIEAITLRDELERVFERAVRYMISYRKQHGKEFEHNGYSVLATNRKDKNGNLCGYNLLLVPTNADVIAEVPA